MIGPVEKQLAGALNLSETQAASQDAAGALDSISLFHQIFATASLTK